MTYFLPFFSIASLAHWQEKSMRTIWFKVKTSHAQIVPTLVEVL